MSEAEQSTDTSEEVEGERPEEARPPSPEELAEHIRLIILEGRKAKGNRSTPVRKGDLKALASYERDITNNYGVKR